ncbi:diaminopimelate dehydrogenase [Stenotrophomonas pictorum JCM 9942]|uniref:Meso-diaminopimelate D-dehydrogenase n=2 Tax=Stenotrophomonas pictorum TaxID=86184 RepID=A0A0R0AEY5_9GAMM|nr:diaminopimelate dehydrogenase [Stenotrophomonas pictorum]KRG43437.1 diaminopimelate dehydrogenase [Stenotrophomonas pictorum JCM 9942]
MGDAIRIGIVGYGNLGRGVELAIARNPDMVLAGVFTRRPPDQVATVSAATPVHGIEALDVPRADIDVLVLCGGSKDDLPAQGPGLAARFNTVDSFDTHARIPEYFDAVDAPARAAGRTALVACGWDPGLFSLNRVFGEALLPEGETYTFWGRGLSQGHSDAIRRVPGVAAGVQYTLPSDAAMAQVRGGARPHLSTRDKHTRHCFVVLEDGADAGQVRQAIVSMPHYFDQYDTRVDFISAEQLAREHSAMPHGGFVIRSGSTAEDVSQVVEYSLKLDSNPQFTASVLVAYARAVYRMNRAGQVGAVTVFDVAPGLLSPRSAAELRRDLL